MKAPVVDGDFLKPGVSKIRNRFPEGFQNPENQSGQAKQG
jgi:hypothetical protein